MSRPLTDQEKQVAKQYWPRMNVDSVVVTGEATRTYNCLAWTLGITTSWVWPWPNKTATKSEFDSLYRSYGFNPAASGEISAFGLNPNAMTHGSISGPGHGPRWESKTGEWLRIQHGLGEMEGGAEYGNVHGFYTHRTGATGLLLESQLMKLEQSEIEAVKQKVHAVPADVRTQFASAYAAWKATWGNPLIAISSNPKDRTQSTQFLDLIAMGPQILPLLVEQLASSDDFFALQAVDRLVPSTHVVSFEVDDPRILGGEQVRAIYTLKRWLSTND